MARREWSWSSIDSKRPRFCARMAFRFQSLWWSLAGAMLATIGGYAGHVAMKSPATAVRSNASAPIRPPIRAVENVVTTSGTVRLRTGAVVRVGAQVSGIISRLNVTVGSKVQKGSVIALVDPSAQLARLEQAKAQIDIDRVARDKAGRDFDRVQKLAQSGLIAVQQVDDLRWQVQLTGARVAKSETDLRAAQIDLSYTTIRAPISGTVASVSTQQGETVAASFAAPTFVTIVDDRALELVAMVDETDIAGVAAGESILFSVEAYPGREFKATVRRIDPTALIISGVVNYPVIAEIAPDANDLKPDMTANIVITKASQTAKASTDSPLYTSGERHLAQKVRSGAPNRKVVQIESVGVGLRGVAANVSEVDRGGLGRGVSGAPGLNL
jgi:RND family efflux transporter MFP subunit